MATFVELTAADDNLARIHLIIEFGSLLSPDATGRQLGERWVQETNSFLPSKSRKYFWNV